MKTLTLLALLVLCALVPVSTPCQTEDSTMCTWDSSSRGNGTGASYIAFTDSIALYYSR